MWRTPSTAPPTVLIPRPELDTIRTVTTSQPSDGRETGGVLLGRRRSEEDVFCIAATRPGPNAEHRHAEFSPDIDYAQSILDDYRTTYNVVWIGTWHKHPGTMNQLSDGDVRQMREFVQDPELVDEIITIVTTYADNRVKLNTFYMDDSLEAVRTEAQIVDNADGYKMDLRYDDSTEEGPDSEDTLSKSDVDTDLG